MQQVKARLRGAKSLDANEIQRDIQEHIERELESEAEPVGCDAVTGVLERLGAPQQWVPDEELSWWRKIIVRMQSGPDDWRLAYICFALFAFGFIALPFWVIFFLPLSCYVARSALSVAGGPDELGEQKKLIYPPLVVFYTIVGLVVLLGPLLGVIGLASESEREIRPWFEDDLYSWLMVWGIILAGSGLWWSMLAGFLLRKRQLLDKLIYPFGSCVTRKRLYKLMAVGVTLLIGGTVAGLVIIMNHAR
jgi:hypothetical protein